MKAPHEIDFHEIAYVVLQHVEMIIEALTCRFELRLADVPLTQRINLFLNDLESLIPIFNGNPGHNEDQSLGLFKDRVHVIGKTGLFTHVLKELRV